MNQKTLVRLQLCYAIAGIGYNVVSSVLVQQGSAALSLTSPVAGIVALVCYAASLLTCRAQSLVPYRVLMGLWVFVFGYDGVLKHILNASSMDAYYSPVAWTMADLEHDIDTDFIGTRGNSAHYDGVIWMEQPRTRRPESVFTGARTKDSQQMPLPEEP